MSEAHINPKILNWAMERSQISFESLAEKIDIKPDKLYLWGNGESIPTFRQAQTLARILHISFGYLFLSNPPEEKLALPDLRTVKDSKQTSISIDFRDLINEVLRKHQWYRDYLLEEGATSLDFVGRYGPSDQFEEVANDISNTLGIDEAFRKSAADSEEFLRKFIQQTERKGILVLRSGIVGNNTHRKLSVNEFRGFNISDKIAPLIFLNGRDSKAAQIFTIAHEIAHLWIGESGISNYGLNEPSIDKKYKIELFCNTVAAQILVPRLLFSDYWKQDMSIENNIHNLVRKYRVSSIVILRRAYDLKKITKKEYFYCYQKEINNYKKMKHLKKRKGGDFLKTFISRNSNSLSTAMIMATLEGKLPYREASRLLGIKVKTLNGIAESMKLR